MPQFGASLTNNSRIIIYDRNMFMVQATDYETKQSFLNWHFSKSFAFISVGTTESTCTSIKLKSDLVEFDDVFGRGFDFAVGMVGLTLEVDRRGVLNDTLNVHLVSSVYNILSWSSTL